ncbi:MAG: colanic acid biosynthesis acetyltransferase WcaF [Deltaproteobacteria bacterium HGW-Deltaproteobacteria-4]|nr:MAG: colanic acid biosynthesis acetyltransferase WcaF [Deltaproteobacteria bacterium HGW-Deltaproteobacteria-4]
MSVDLSRFNNSWYNPGCGFFVRTLWHYVNAVFLQSPLNPSSKLKIIILRMFGAKIGQGVVLKPSINVKYPWKLEIGDYSWIGENVWLDSLAPITIGSNVCISQGVYFCTGNHDWTDPAFGLIVKPIVIEDGAWVGARATVLPGVTIKSHSIVAAGSVIAKDTDAYGIYVGNPAMKVKERKIRS